MASASVYVLIISITLHPDVARLRFLHSFTVNIGLSFSFFLSFKSLTLTMNAFPSFLCSVKVAVSLSLEWKVRDELYIDSFDPSGFFFVWLDVGRSIFGVKRSDSVPLSVFYSDGL